MTLEIRGIEKTIDIIELEKYGKNMKLRINDELIATIYEDGNFTFYGHSTMPKFNDRWKK